MVGSKSGYRERMNRFPLQDLRLVNTRAAHQAAALTTALEERGAEVLEFPTIALERILDNGELEMAIKQLECFDWVLLTSTNAVRGDNISVKRIAWGHSDKVLLLYTRRFNVYQFSDNP